MASPDPLGRRLLSRPSHLHFEEDKPVMNHSWDWETASGFGSSGSSEFGSAGVESVDDDYVDQLVRQMAHSMLQEDDAHIKIPDGKDLCGIGNCGSPQGYFSREQSPPAPTRVNGEGNDWCLLHDFSGKFDKMNMRDNGSRYTKSPDKELHSRQVLRDNQIRAVKFHERKQEQFLKPQGNKAGQVEPRQERRQSLQSGGRACRGCNNNRHSNNTIRPLGLPPCAWPSLQQQHQRQKQPFESGMRAIFLGGSEQRSGSGGTGVFLPRGNGNPTDSRKKRGCSTALIPERVAQALKLNLDDMGFLSRSGAGDSSPHHDTAVSARSWGASTQQTHRSRTLPAMTHQYETCLPQEWTY